MDKIIAVLGLGYVGLPLVNAFCNKNIKVIGYDIDKTKIEKLNNGISYIDAVSSSNIKSHISNNILKSTFNEYDLKEADVLIICVPTPLNKNKEPDLSYIVGTTEVIAKILRKNQTVILESTTYPGTTIEVVKPILEATGLECGRDFFLGFSPERENPGDKNWTIDKMSKVIGADDSKSLEILNSVYSPIVSKVVKVSSTKIAEATKILENTYRAVNIALVNELKMVFHEMGINIFEVIEASATKPFGFQAFYPGPGLGGHCIPIDPFYLTWKAKEYNMNTKLIELSGEINTEMPKYVVNRTIEALNNNGKSLKGSRVLLIGMAYKPDVDDYRESPALELLEIFEKWGSIVKYYDPHVPTLKLMRRGDFSHYQSEKLDEFLLQAQDIVVIVTNHNIIDWNLVGLNSNLIVDTRNAMKNYKDREHIYLS